MSEAGLLNFIPYYQQVNILGNNIFFRLYNIFFLCSREVIKIIAITFLFVVFCSNTAIKLAFLSRSFGRPRNKFKFTKVFVI
jgi:hypothetical protein